MAIGHPLFWFQRKTTMRVAAPHSKNRELLSLYMLIGGWMLSLFEGGVWTLSRLSIRPERMFLRALSAMVTKPVVKGMVLRNMKDIDLTAGSLPKNGKIA